MSELPQFYLPDLFAQWPWPRLSNQHYEETKPEFDEWVRSLEALDAKSQSAFDRCNFALLSSIGHPLLDKECFRVACDLMALYFMYDEYTDKLDEEGVRTCADLVLDALRSPHKERPQDESKLGEIARQFWLRAIKVASEGAQRRFIKSFAEYAYSIIEETSDRNAGRVRNITDYLELRRRTAAVYSTLFLVELGIDIPDEVMTHPAMVSLLSLAIDPLMLTNDLYSYNIEQAAGHGSHNFLTAIMNDKGVDLDEALDWFAEYNGTLLSKVQEQCRALPSWNPDIDPIVTTYVERLCYWLRGHDCWSFESGRYFGTKGPEIQKHRVVTLLPRSNGGSEVTPMMALPVDSTSGVD
ncbi:terpenoid synthase [Lactarius akahatsu]|uniref:Terpene synthase n=1 Tax=Lactarius akahatsu TaxID=416441 RepID=A0AAD4LJ44_9AGAM|nr:terpenoid synthase [Lactarius akahatsu]